MKKITHNQNQREVSNDEGYSCFHLYSVGTVGRWCVRSVFHYQNLVLTLPILYTCLSKSTGGEQPARIFLNSL